MPRKKTDKRSYPLRLTPSIMEAIERWAEDDLRSTNAQVEFLLRDALRRSGRLKDKQAMPPDPSDDSED